VIVIKYKDMKRKADLEKFLEAQEKDYSIALAEIKNGRKQSHWIWYIFPQIAGLGFSGTSAFYAIEDLQHASDYLQHPVLGSRLIEVSRSILGIEGKTARQILGSPDDLKLRSSMTLFSLADQSDPVFAAVLDKYFEGKPDPKTIALLKEQKSNYL